MSYYTNSKNPYTNAIDRPYVLWSASQGGASSSDYRIGTSDVTIPASPNYPPSESGASTSYFIYTRWDFYKTSTNSTQFYLYNETQSKIITVVDQDASLSDYTGKFMGQGSEKRNIIECHVGTTSNQASDVISYKSVVSGSAFDAYEINNFEVDTLIVNSTNGMFVDSFTAKNTNNLRFYDNIDVSGNFEFKHYITSTATYNYFLYDTSLSSPIIETYSSQTINGLQFLSVKRVNSTLSTEIYHNSFYTFKSYIIDQFSVPIDTRSTQFLFSVINNNTTSFNVYGSGGIQLAVKTLSSDITCNNLNTAFGNSTSLGAGFVGYFTTGTGVKQAMTDGTTSWYIFTGTVPTT